mmetsp:Transcript_102855/g.291267  ORF Transcript_102855/g.291267 Transcript_102855/m.291267 type:complete len:211 (-) Transcript_102855:1217-1849(-)
MRERARLHPRRGLGVHSGDALRPRGVARPGPAVAGAAGQLHAGREHVAGEDVRCPRALRPAAGRAGLPGGPGGEGRSAGLDHFRGSEVPPRPRRGARREVPRRARGRGRAGGLRGAARGLGAVPARLGAPDGLDAEQDAGGRGHALRARRHRHRAAAGPRGPRADGPRPAAAPHRRGRWPRHHRAARLRRLLLQAAPQALPHRLRPSVHA